MYRCPLEIQLFCLEGQLKCESKNVPLCNAILVILTGGHCLNFI